MNNNTWAHQYIKNIIHKEDICIDMTLGNGNDALFLCGLTKKVYGIDISNTAIESSKKRLSNCDNITYIHDNHIHIDQYVKEKVNLVIFNLGYLPHNDEVSITKADETLVAFEKAYFLLQDNGYIIITFYVGHEGGKEEYELLQEYINKNRLLVLETYSQNKINSPITYIIQKTNSEH